MTCDIPRQARFLAVLLGVVVLLAVLEQSILSDVVVLANLLWIVPGTR